MNNFRVNNFRANNYKVLVLGLVVLLLLANIALACPTCKDGMENDKDQANMVQGFFWSIVFMMSMPFLILLGLGGYFFYLVSKTKAKNSDVDGGAKGIALPVVPAGVLASVTQTGTMTASPAERVLS